MKAERNISDSALPAHPCFDKEAKHSHARVHLPVAPKCNIQCNYCNRKYDCVNESRPGVTSAVLSPHQALTYLRALHEKLYNISVIGIAGPGDPFANPDETLKTLELVHEAYPEKIFCLSTNGLNISPYIGELVKYNVSHVTITMNAVRPETAKHIYAWVRKDKKVYRGTEGAEVLLSAQLEAIRQLKDAGITVKINSIILPGINEDCFGEIASTVARLGADVMNCIPVYPNEDTAFAQMEKPPSDMIRGVRSEAQNHIELMTHCARCRADAAGLLGADLKDAFGLIREYAAKPLQPEENRPFIAVATQEGLLVNLHLGEAKSLYVYRQTPNGYQFVGEREAPVPGSGDFRWIQMAELLKDCRALLTSGAGNNPVTIMQNAGIRVIQTTGLIDEGLEAVYENRPMRTVNRAEIFKCGSGCQGNARGCA